MVIRNAGTTKVQRTLDFPNTNGVTVFQEKPVNFPCFAPKSILKLYLIAHSKSALNAKT